MLMLKAMDFMLKSMILILIISAKYAAGLNVNVFSIKLNEEKPRDIKVNGSLLFENLLQELEDQKSGDVFLGEKNINVLQHFTVDVDLNKAVSSTGPKFVGVTIDVSFFRSKQKSFILRSKALQSLAFGLAPNFLRVGGTAADFLIFKSNSNAVQKNDSKSHSDVWNWKDNLYYRHSDVNFTFNGKEFQMLYNLTTLATWDLIFDLNLFLRHGDAWDSGNALQLLQFAEAHGYKIPCFQLGNEPDAYPFAFNITITPLQLVKDMQLLKSVLAGFPLYQDSCIVGPEVTKVTKDSARKYLQEFLSAGGKDIVSAVTLHHYYFSVQPSKVSVYDFINITILDSLKDELTIATSIVRDIAPNIPVWLSETSSVSGGGVYGITDTFVAGFMWLDKLGLSAVYGLQSVIRQTFIEGSYPLVANDTSPCPDYYLTLLFKRLVQGPVMKVMASSNEIRVYAHCSNPASYPAGALTVYALNLLNTSISLDLTQFPDQLLHLYLLTPGDDQGLTSKYVALNGKKLIANKGMLPPLLPQSHSGPFIMSPLSFGFVVIPGANVTLCQQ